VHEKKQQITFKSTTISHLENKQSLNAQHHHLECRGCEWDNVFIYLHSEFLSNPNYLYMLMCRTKDYLALAGDETQIKQMKELLQKSK
jgi:hypothetical protein